MAGDRFYQMFKDRSCKSEILGLGDIWTLLCRSMTSQLYSVGLRSGELVGQDINWNSASCSWSHSNRIWALFCWNIPFPVGKTDAMYEFNWSSMMFRYSVAFKVQVQPLVPKTSKRTFQKHSTATIGQCMTCCTLREQQFAWKTAYPDTAIGVMNDKP